MKITRAPDPERVQTYKTGCWRCHCEFEFTGTEADLEPQGPSNVHLYVNCPSCNTRLMHRMPMPSLVPAK